ncbi:MAG: prepilin-type N-terminal cleavage/methylation domain-containing protein [Croceibacterium sp.]
MTGAPSRHSAGFTLIELLIALVLFALISLAGASLIETTAGVAQRTAGRTDRLAEIQRALYLIGADFEQLTAGPEAVAGRVSLTRASVGGDYAVDYYLAGEAVHRVAAGADRVILSGVSALGWRYFRDGSWQDRPADPLSAQQQQATAPSAPMRPRGVEMTLTVTGTVGLAGPVRRVFELPAQP